MMSNIETSRIHKVDVGAPPSSTATSDIGWEIIQVHYHDFENLTTTRGERVVSPEFTCFGHTWSLHVYPGGSTNSDDGMVRISLRNMSNKSIKVQFGFSIKNKGHKSKRDFALSNEGAVFAPRATAENKDALGVDNFCERSTIINNRVDGTMIIEVRMRKIGETTSAPFVPENPISKNILSKFMDEESADVVFEVGTQSEIGRNTRKRAKTSTTFYAHRLILQDGATMLGEMCKSDGKSNAISITDVSPEIFRHLLYYVYGGKIPDDG